MVIATLFGYFLLVVFFYMESRGRNGAEAKSLEAGPFDRRSTRFLGLGYFIALIALLAAWPLNAMGIAGLPEWLGWNGIVLGLAGLAMRTWANRVLGAYYTRRLRVAEGQAIIRAGPYRVIRHPGYLGMILMWIGAALATGNWLATLVVLIVIVSAYHYRIQKEEQMLLGKLPGYGEYRSSTWRLLPPIY